MRDYALSNSTVRIGDIVTDHAGSVSVDKIQWCMSLGDKPALSYVYETQDPKYVIIDNKICNKATCKPIPDDEPIMIFRAKDKKATSAIAAYGSTYKNTSHRAAITKRMEDFWSFEAANPKLMKEPDTD